MDFIDNQAQILLRGALAALNRRAGITGHVIDGTPATALSTPTQPLVEIEANGRRQRYVVEIRRIARFITLGEIKNRHPAEWGHAAPDNATRYRGSC